MVPYSLPRSITLDTVVAAFIFSMSISCGMTSLSLPSLSTNWYLNTGPSPTPLDVQPPLPKQYNNECENSHSVCSYHLKYHLKALTNREIFQ